MLEVEILSIVSLEMQMLKTWIALPQSLISCVNNFGEGVVAALRAENRPRNRKGIALSMSRSCRLTAMFVGKGNSAAAPSFGDWMSLGCRAGLVQLRFGMWKGLWCGGAGTGNLCKNNSRQFKAGAEASKGSQGSSHFRKKY